MVDMGVGLMDNMGVNDVELSVIIYSGRILNRQKVDINNIPMEEYSISLVSQNQHSLIIESRNLRAKIRSMLPTDNCHKYQDRNKRLLQVLQKKSQLNALYPKPQTYTTLCSHNHRHQYHIEHFSKQSANDTFLTLTDSEIERICENKEYYFGQGYVGSFNKFLEEKEMQRQKENHIKSQARSSKNSFLSTKQGETIYRFNKSNTFPEVGQSLNKSWNKSQVRSPNTILGSKLQGKQGYENKLAEKQSHRCDVYQRYQQIILARQGYRNLKENTTKIKMNRVKTNLEEEGKRHKEQNRRKKQRMQKVQLRVRQLQEEETNSEEFKRMASELKRICGSKTNTGLGKDFQITKSSLAKL